MKVSGIDIESNINNIKVQIETDNTLSPSMRIAMDLLLLIVTLLCRRLGLNSNNSNNSSIPSSSVQNRKKNSNGNSTKKSDGQKRHKGTTLPLDDNPDITHKLIVDSTTAQ
jgi:transposase